MYGGCSECVERKAATNHCVRVKYNCFDAHLFVDGNYAAFEEETVRRTQIECVVLWRLETRSDGNAPYFHITSLPTSLVMSIWIKLLRHYVCRVGLSHVCVSTVSRWVLRVCIRPCMCKPQRKHHLACNAPIHTWDCVFIFRLENRTHFHGGVCRVNTHSRRKRRDT